MSIKKKWFVGNYVPANVFTAKTHPTYYSLPIIQQYTFYIMTILYVVGCNPCINSYLYICHRSILGR